MHLVRAVLVAFLVLLSHVPVATAQAAPAAASTPGSATAAAYVDAVYEVFLDRTPSSEEVDRWRPTAQWGELSALTGALAVSDEWAGTRVDALYRRILGRAPDVAGHDHWVRTIANGSTLEHVAALLYGSHEYFEPLGSNGAYVDSLYQRLLGRAAEPSGRRFWVERIEAGASRSSVASGFYAAIESRSQRVVSLFRELLGRSPEPAGHDYWADQLQWAGDVSLAAFLAASDEFHLRATGEPAPTAPRAIETGFGPYATVGEVTLVHPAGAVERIGFHESGHDGSQQVTPTSGAVRWLTMETRYRGTGSRTAADIVVPPDTEVRAPVTGRVVRSGTYRLYCDHRDDYAVVEPDARPGWEVVVLHIDGVLVRAGDRVQAGVTPIAPRATVLPFESQVDRHTAVPSWPHVHVEVIDPSIPDEHSGSC